MTRLIPSGLRARLLLLVLLAIIPSVALTLYTTVEERAAAAQAARDDALQLTALAASNQEQLIEGARQLLVAAAQIRAVRTRDAEGCAEALGDLLNQSPLYTNLVAAAPNGALFCSALPLTQPIEVADRAWFQGAVQARDFAVGEYQIGRVSGEPVLTFGYPVLDNRGRILAVVGAGLDLAALNQFVAGARLPPGAVVSVVDRNGTIVARYPEPEKWVGQTAPEAPLIKVMLAQREGVTEARGLDGVPRLYAFTPLRSRVETGLHTSVGIPTAVAFAEPNRILRRSLAALGIVSLLALAAAWLGSDVFVLRQVTTLCEATRRLASGDLKTRTGIPPGPGELNHLARAFDDMAAALERREAEHQRAETRFSGLLESAPDATVITDTDGRIVLVNRQAEALFGYRRDELLGEPVEILQPERFHAAHVRHRGAFAARPRGREMGTGIELYGRRKDGAEFPVEVSLSPIELEGEALITSSIRDITERKRAEEERTRLIGGQAALIEENARLFNTLQQQFEELRRSRQLIISAQEDLRREIAELLHGRVQTRLLLAWHRLGQCERLLAADPAKARALLAEIRADIDQIREQEVRQASHLLHPAIIRVGLVPAVRSLARRFEHEIAIAVDVDPALDQLDDPVDNRIPEPLRLTAYRIVEEALTNVLRHAGAGRVDISLKLDGGRLAIAVRDDGRGFDPAGLKPAVGLSSVAGRVSQFGGTWQIASAAGQGTTLSATLPLPDAGAGEAPSAESHQPGVSSAASPQAGS